jgi:hypothetical protein
MLTRCGCVYEDSRKELLGVYKLESGSRTLVNFGKLRGVSYSGLMPYSVKSLWRIKRE